MYDEVLIIEFSLLDTDDYHSTESVRSVIESIMRDYCEDSILCCWGYEQNGKPVEELTVDDDEDEVDEGLDTPSVEFEEVIDVQLFFTSFLE